MAFGLVIVRDRDVSLWSWKGTDLTQYFPDLAETAEAQLPAGVVVDGEAVVWREGRLSFDELQHRFSSSAITVARLAHEWPASYAAFDVLAVADKDARNLPLRDRRALLEELASGWSAPLNLSPATRDAGEAAEWLETMIAAGIEGLVAKGADQPYRGGQRVWVKVKHRDTLDVVCAAVIGLLQRPEALVVRLPIDRELRIVGRSTPLRAAASRALGQLVQPELFAHLLPDSNGLPGPFPPALDFFARRRAVTGFREHVTIEWRRRALMSWDKDVTRASASGGSSGTIPTAPARPRTCWCLSRSIVPRASHPPGEHRE